MIARVIGERREWYTVRVRVGVGVRVRFRFGVRVREWHAVAACD